MPHVNLVPQSERRLAVRRQMLVFPAAGAAALVLLLGGSYLYYNNKLSNTNDDLNMYKQNSANLAKQVSELQKYEDLKNQKQARLSAVASAYQARFRWSRLLDDVSFVIPETISLEKMIKGGRAGSYSLVPMACFSAALLWRRAGLRRFPMEAAVWSRYCKLNNNLSIRWLCWRRIRLKMQEPRFSGIQPLKKNRP